MSGLRAHLAGGATTTCYCWAVTRRDGVVLGFTDHDRDLSFEGVVFRADTGLTAGALQHLSGLAVDNAEAVGALSDAAVREEDLRAGRFDGAGVRMWMVNWADVGSRMLCFAGQIGEVTEGGGAFRAELRGLSEALNRVQGRVIQPGCDAVLGDARCGVDLSAEGFGGTFTVLALRERRMLVLDGAEGYEPGWFLRGKCRVMTGQAAGLGGAVKADWLEPGGRVVELWEELRIAPEAGDVIDLRTGCDKLGATCRGKFGNFLNFRGFPDVPTEDFIAASPAREVAAGRGA